MRTTLNVKATRRALRVIGVVAISASIAAQTGVATLHSGWRWSPGRYDGGGREARPRSVQPTKEAVALASLPVEQAPAGVATAPVMTAEQAVAHVVNDLTATDDGYRLSHPRYTAEFTAEGLDFAPRRAGPDWHWKLDFVGTQAGALADVATTTVGPRRESSLLVRYDRGALIEQYVLGGNSIEQQFVIPAPLALDGHDLVVAGAVASGGKIETPAEGWQWRTDTGAVTLGRVSVFDAEGTPLPATMEVTATATRIVVDEAALARAVYPVLIDPEVGVNDFRISDMGPDGSVAFGAGNPAVAYNANPGALPATVTVTYLREGALAPIVKTYTLPATSRLNVVPALDGLSNESFGALITSTQPIAVERALYASTGGVFWGAGTNATGTKIP